MNMLRRTTSSLLNLLNVGFIICLLLSISASYINPTDADYFPLVGLAYLPLLVVTALFLFRRSTFRTNLFWASLVVVLYASLFIGRFIQISIPTHKPKNSIRLLTYNVRSFNLENWNVDKKAGFHIFDLIKKESPDIVCIQEYASRPKAKLQIVQEFRKLGYRYRYPAYNNKYTTYGNSIFSRYPILLKDSVAEKNNLDFNQLVDLKIGSDTIRLINNHLTSVQLTSMETSTDFGLEQIDSITKKLKRAFYGRTAQAKWLKFEIETTPYPIILCGDFNDTPMSYTYHLTSKHLYDAFMEKGNGIGASFWIKFIPLRIDYFLHSKEIKVHTYRTLPVKYSDHYPLVVDFSIGTEK